MPNNNKKNSESFKSIQILSAKAQSLWSKARSRVQESSMRGKDVELPAKKLPGTVLLEVRSYTVVKVLLLTLLVAGAAVLLFAIRDKLLLVGLAIFIAVVMDSHVRRLERMRIPRALAVILIYLVFVAVTIFLIASLIPIVAQQLRELADYLYYSENSFLTNPQVNLPFVSESMNAQLTSLMHTTMDSMGIKDSASVLLQFGNNLSTATSSWVSFAVQVAGSVLNFFVNFTLILVLAFFIQLEREKISEFVRGLLPRDYRPYFDVKTAAVYQKLSQWFQGQLILCFSIGLLVFVALKVLGMPYALTLGLLAGFVEFIPYAGPLIAALPSILIAMSQQGLFWGLVVAIVYYVIQICENNLLVPLIMKHAVGLSPISIIVGMLIGVSFPGTVHPVVGVILAVPTTAIITIFVQDFYLMRKKK